MRSSKLIPHAFAPEERTGRYPRCLRLKTMMPVLSASAVPARERPSRACRHRYWSRGECEYSRCPMPSQTPPATAGPTPSRWTRHGCLGQQRRIDDETPQKCLVSARRPTCMLSRPHHAASLNRCSAAQMPVRPALAGRKKAQDQGRASDERAPGGTSGRLPVALGLRLCSSGPSRRPN